MFAAIYIPAFSLQAVLRHEPELYWQATALVDGDATKGTLVQLTDAARAAGVEEGMSAAQAMARCAGLVFKPISADAEHAATAVLLQSAAAFSPNIENTASGVCTIDLKGLGFDGDLSRGGEWWEDWNSIENASSQQSFGFLEQVPVRSCAADPSAETPAGAWLKNLLAVLESLHLHAQAGIAATPAFALLAARAARPLLVVKKPREFAADLPVEALDPPAPMLDILRRWGIHRAGQVVALGKDALAERLGVDAIELLDRVSPEMTRPLDIVVAPDAYEEQVDFEAPVETLEPLLFILRRFVEQLATRIALNYRVVSELTLRLSLESGPPYERGFKVPAPTGHVDTLFRMLQTHLETVRTDAPIIALRLAATPCRAENQQFGLFESALRDPNQFHETIARLTALLGSDRVGTPVVEQSHRPDTFHLRPPVFGDTSRGGAAPGRARAAGLALRRFRPAVHAEVETEQGKPVFVRTLLVSSPVQRARGPWIGSGDWWDQRRWSRNEWDVELRDGAIYRLYSSDHNWFLEGRYD